MNFGRQSLLIGLIGSVLVHATFAFAIIILVAGGVSGFKGAAGRIFMVSYEEAGALLGAKTGIPAFSSPAVSPLLRQRAAEPQRLKSYAASPARRFSLSESALETGASFNLGASNGGRSDGLLKIVVAPKPPYPPEARRGGFEGRVLLDVEVAPDGRVASVVLKKSSGRVDCDQSARSTILHRWKFAPFSSVSSAHQLIAVRFALS